MPGSRLEHSSFVPPDGQVDNELCIRCLLGLKGVLDLSVVAEWLDLWGRSLRLFALFIATAFVITAALARTKRHRWDDRIITGVTRIV